MPSRVEATATPTVEMIGRARRGDREAYGELVEMMWPQLVALARTILAGDDEAEDLVQEALVHAWSRLGTLRQAEKFPPWIRRIVARRCLAHSRRRRLPAESVPVVPAASPVERIDVTRVLRRLAPRQRAVVYLTLVEGHSAAEAAAILGILPATARVHRHRAMARLRAELEEWRR